MRLSILTIAVLAVPAAAQFAPRPQMAPLGSGGSGSNWSRDLGQVHDRIDAGRDSGRLGRQEARRLRREARQIGTLGERYAQGGLSDAEARELETRNAVLRSEVDQRRSGIRPTRR